MYSTCLTVVQDLVVEAVEVFRVAREGHPIACHGVPAAHSEEATLVILTDQILQHRPVVNEGMQVTEIVLEIFFFKTFHNQKEGNVKERNMRS